MIYELVVYGFGGGIIYIVGEKDVKQITCIFDSNTGALGYRIDFGNGEAHVLDGNFQYIAKEKANK